MQTGTCVYSKPLGSCPPRLALSVTIDGAPKVMPQYCWNCSMLLALPSPSTLSVLLPLRRHRARAWLAALSPTSCAHCQQFRLAVQQGYLGSKHSLLAQRIYLVTRLIKHLIQLHPKLIKYMPNLDQCHHALISPFGDMTCLYNVTLEGMCPLGALPRMEDD